jgi:hypothetical protein
MLNGRQSTEGGAEMCGELGREDCRLINRRLEPFFSLLVVEVVTLGLELVGLGS